MGRIIVEQNVSADGFAAGPDGDISWFDDRAVDFTEHEPGQLRMLEAVDAIVLGATTYGIFASYWPTADPLVEGVAEPINRLPKHVISNTLERAPWGDHPDLAIERGDGVESLRRLRANYDGDVIVWGSLTLTDALFRAGEVDVLRLTSVPLLIGAGRGATPDGIPTIRLRLEDSQVSPSGLITAQYAVGRG